MHKGQRVSVPVKNRNESLIWVTGEIVGVYQGGRWALVEYPWGDVRLRGGWMREEVRAV